ncbi:TPA: lpg2912 family Dot/Icm T4SS effector [Legionella pneumophila]|nr:lpg2912 family Dot/Icm T4SS effector [Legionella pneumophila]HAU0870285.1 lpg2912 family Dot/Icm T4SS effector [Legionella pneumophila]HAU0888654.1 lpg2912 family Dot/Icm T4SS effector [Legionella pneumophila]HCD9491242.1 lpg2912 family Dot/Icm T4SS effector [Legionella pneumophila]HCD9497211.1 lpg2912 family Dot/Icm T4SS effector [Legionella pneumophila]
MSYSKIDVLERKWSSLEAIVKSYTDPVEYHLPEIKKLMTAEFVVDFSSHAIYLHTEYVHRFTQQLINLQNASPNDERLLYIHQLWTDLLNCRNQNPLKIKHHKKLDGECTFNFSLKMMEGKPYGFKEVQILDPNNTAELNKAMGEIKRIDSLAHGANFGDLPFIGDIVLSSMLHYKETICFIAKDKNDEVIGYCWGMMLRDIPAGEKDKVNVFWVMNLAKHPDFYDPNIKVGEALRQHLANTLSKNPDCHFLGYEHVLNHNFHLAIVDGGVPKKEETISIGQNQYQAKSLVKYEPLKMQYDRKHIIKTNNHQYPYPKVDIIKSNFFTALWYAAPTAFDFILGGILIYGRAYYQQWTHSMLGQPVTHRIEKPISQEQQICDMNILKRIILSDVWGQQGTTLFFDACIPNTIQKLQQLVKEDQIEFASLQQCVAKSGWALCRSKLTAYFYFAITQSQYPSAAINLLIQNDMTPKKWIELISEERQIFAQQSSERASI